MSTPRPTGLLALAAGSALLAALYAARVAHSGRGVYGFLLFNLALAWVPWVCAGLFERALARERLPLATGLALAWLAFLPNAPYLITDFLHLRPRPPVPLWYDVILLGDAALAGLVAGAASLRTVRRAVGERFGAAAARAVVGLAVPATGLGIYLGRFERLNSWDLVTDPGSVLRALTHLTSPRALVVSAATAGLCAVAFLALAEGQPTARSARREP